MSYISLIGMQGGGRRGWNCGLMLIQPFAMGYVHMPLSKRICSKVSRGHLQKCGIPLSSLITLLLNGLPSIFLYHDLYLHYVQCKLSDSIDLSYSQFFHLSVQVSQQPNTVYRILSELAALNLYKKCA